MRQSSSESTAQTANGGAGPDELPAADEEHRGAADESSDSASAAVHAASGLSDNEPNDGNAGEPRKVTDDDIDASGVDEGSPGDGSPGEGSEDESASVQPDRLSDPAPGTGPAYIVVDPPVHDDLREQAQLWGDFPQEARGAFDPLGELQPDGVRQLPRGLLHHTTGIEFVHVPGGRFGLGNDASRNQDERPERPVRISGFYLARTELSLAQWRSGGGATPPDMPAWHTSAEFPVVAVSWHAARDWCHRNGFELPSEAQWEYAAAGSEERAFPWGHTWVDGKANLALDDDGYEHAAPVGRFAGDCSWCGVQDLAGNVSEWCADRYVDNLKWVAGDSLDPVQRAGAGGPVERGGCFTDDHPVRSTYRFGYSPAPTDDLGLRPVYRP